MIINKSVIIIKFKNYYNFHGNKTSGKNVSNTMNSITITMTLGTYHENISLICYLQRSYVLSSSKNMYFPVKEEKSINTIAKYDGIIYVYAPDDIANNAAPLETVVRAAAIYDGSLGFNTAAVIPLSDVPGGRMVVSCTGEIDPDYDDVRQYRDAAVKAMKKALEAGIRAPLLYLQGSFHFPDADLVTLLGVFEALYVPLQIRELKPSNMPVINYLGIVHENPLKLKNVISLAKTLEEGRLVARDISDGDPKRMAPPKVRQYVEEQFKTTNIKISVVDDDEVFRTEYPLFEAVNRAASVVDRHKGCIMFLEYDPKTSINKTLMLVGKGVTFDSGGVNLKINGAMMGMSKDKSGAGVVAGFMKIVSQLRPTNIKVIAALSLVCNCIGSNALFPDELIKARSGQLVRIVNTDAEGRLIMADVLCKMKELAVTMVNPELFTVATLTGHAQLTVGNEYSIAIDNGPARKAGISVNIQKAGSLIADPFELSILRREDILYNRGKVPGDDIIQCGDQPSTKVSRGHQSPVGFLLLASGLDKYGSGSRFPIKYTHLDIAGPSLTYPKLSTAAPLLALTKALLL